MKKTLFLKFTAAYAILALLMFLVTTTLGRQLFYDSLVSDCAEKLYAEASVIAGSRASRYFQRTTTIEDLYENMLTIAASNNAVIRVIDTNRTVLVNTSTPLRKDEPDVIENFDYAAFGPRYYEISSFFGQYSQDQLTVMYPVTANMRTRGYVAISVPVNTLDEGSRSLTHLAEILTLVNFILSLGILLFFGYAIYRPLIRITEGARAFSNGNMTHKINVRSLGDHIKITIIESCSGIISYADHTASLVYCCIGIDMYGCMIISVSVDDNQGIVKSQSESVVIKQKSCGIIIVKN